MDYSIKKKRNKLIYPIVIIAFSLVIIMIQYFILYTIGENNIDNYINKQIKRDSGISELTVMVIDEIKTEYGLVVLFETSVQEKPIGYAVFRRDGILKRYCKEDFALYNNRVDYINDMDVLVDLKNEIVFQFTDNEIKILNRKSSNRKLREYYAGVVFVILTMIYGLFKLWKIPINFTT